MSGTPRLLLVVNRAAGSAGDGEVEVSLRTLRAGADTAVVATGSPAELDAALAGRDGRRVVVLGGDGSVHAVARALERAGALDAAEPVASSPRARATTWRGPWVCRWSRTRGRPSSSPGDRGRWT